MVLKKSKKIAAIVGGIWVSNFGGFPFSTNLMTNSKTLSLKDEFAWK
jgi:hypothetical protein